MIWQKNNNKSISKEIVKILGKIEEKAREMKGKEFVLKQNKQPHEELFRKYLDMLYGLDVSNEKDIEKFIEANIIRIISLVMGFKQK